LRQHRIQHTKTEHVDDAAAVEARIVRRPVVQPLAQYVGHRARQVRRPEDRPKPRTLERSRQTQHQLHRLLRDAGEAPCPFARAADDRVHVVVGEAESEQLSPTRPRDQEPGRSAQRGRR
jgi:hypothetical protein